MLMIQLFSEHYEPVGKGPLLTGAAITTNQSNAFEYLKARGGKRVPSLPISIFLGVL